MNWLRRDMSGPEIGPQLYIQAYFPGIAGSQRQAVQNVKVVRMLEFVQEIHQALVVSLDGGGNFYLHQAPIVRIMLMECNRVRPQTGRMRQLAKVFAYGGISGARGTEMRRKEFVPLLFVHGQFGTEFVKAPIVRPVGFFQHIQALDFIRGDSWRLVEPVIDSDENHIEPQNDDEYPARHRFADLKHFAHLRGPNTGLADRAGRDRLDRIGSRSIRS